ncbi:hypothetical protein SUVZ_01G0750 [Saccharomyces uvarum]|uniref:Uncharacterized protein n=1 Tax=Saccharomyces uvarum TaxID=230603 RepID=A0ABN8WQN6_SACUV|nr:hypothetical protein SUVZ_01G0750 [Saccharomyces uvarum]
MESRNDGVDDGVKLDTLNRDIPDELNAPLISEDIALPEDIFRSHFTYLLNEWAHNRPIVLLFVVLVVLVLLLVAFWDNLIDDHVAYFVILIMSTLIVSCCLLGFTISFSERHILGNAEIKLLLEVIARKPPIEGVEWKVITYNMNQYLNDGVSWGTPYFFYCKSDCYRTFKKLMKGNISRIHSDPPTSNDTNSQATGTSNGVSESFRFGVDPTVEGYYVKAAEVQKQALREYWKKEYPDIEVP